MLALNNLKPSPGSRKSKKRVGRGTSSGLGKTGGRGHKGQTSRAGGTKGRRFEGGQTPLYRRLPKRGFKNYPFRKRYVTFNLDQLADLTARGAGLIEAGERIKVLGRGKVLGAVEVSAHKFSAEAVKKIEAAGGKAIIINA